MAFILSIVSWLTGSELGRKVALWGMATLGVLLILWRIYAAGKASEKARQAQASLENLRTRIKVDDEITKLPPDQRKKQLEEWASD